MIFKFMPKCSSDPLNTKRSFPQNTGMGYMKMHGFHGNPLYDFEIGGEPSNSIISRFLLILSTKLGVRYVNLLICIFMNINENLKHEIKS